MRETFQGGNLDIVDGVVTGALPTPCHGQKLQGSSKLQWENGKKFVALLQIVEWAALSTDDHLHLYRHNVQGRNFHPTAKL